MPPTVDESWDTIVDWLSRHSPPELALVRPPAAEDDIRYAAGILGAILPDDLVAWWLRADGYAGTGSLLPPFYSPYPVLRALDARDSWMTAWSGVMEHHAPEQFAAWMAQQEGAPAGSPCSGAWLSNWLPIASNAGGADLFVDLRPGPAHGCVREFFSDAGAGDAALWSGVAAMLAEVAEGLERGAPVDGFRIWVEDDGRIAWDRDAFRWAIGGSTRANVARLRDAYAAFVAEVRAGGFGAPPAGTWPAEWIAAHVARNTELLIATTQSVLADDPGGRERQRIEALDHRDGLRFRQLQHSAQRAAANIRYDNSDAMDPVTLDRYATVRLATLASQVEQLGARLCDLVEPLHGRPAAHVHVIDEGNTIIDGRQGWHGVLNALWMRQLPLRTRQLRTLR